MPANTLSTHGKPATSVHMAPVEQQSSKAAPIGGPCQCRLTPDGPVVCPRCAEARLLALLEAAPNARPSAEELEALRETLNAWFASMPQTEPPTSFPGTQATVAGTTAGRRPVLPPHLRVLGEQRPLLAGQGRRWLGCARATPEELCDLKGIVLYDEAVCCFLSAAEAREVFVLLGRLLIQPGALSTGEEEMGSEPMVGAGQRHREPLAWEEAVGNPRPVDGTCADQ